MSPKFDDDLLLQISSSGASAFGALGLLGMDQTHDVFFKNERQNHPEIQRLWGCSCAMAGANGLLVARSDDEQLKKDTMKVHGVAWHGTAAMSAYNSHNGTQRKEVGYTTAGFSAALGGLLLVRGFRKDDEDRDNKKQEKPKKETRPK
ncbi:hypothetical protein HXX76_010667 [Chlamydomonas incerta]|uniref:Uncharacterized protein n=1 Tax=Chlamydomonas incerta TaxID=51695 RepID=A0A835SR85_CHLIN|nr:hypothetical protein HXX76_010667 [Chlamydomonas incerta]|eukprot:KAG2429887.1 hypothetical protein HXX76_010667 [Chlamydomonas incerta]